MERRMNSKTLREAEELAAIAQTLTPLEQALLQSLQTKGPGVLLEVAVSVYKFPDEIAPEITRLRDWGLIEADTLSGVKFGNEILYLSTRGRQALDLLRDEVRQPVKAAQSRGLGEATLSVDPRQQEIDLLRKLGDLAVQAGDAVKARDYYEQALQITRKLDPGA